MAHPILDRSPYAWHLQEAVDLFEALVASIPQQAEIAQLYAQAGGDPSVLNTAQAPRRLWNDALELLVQQEALRRFCKHVLPGVQRLKRAAGFQAALKAVVDLTAERKVIARIQMVASPSLRDLIDRLKTDPALRVLLVRDDLGTEASQARDLFVAAAAERGAHAVYLYEPIIALVDDVVENLFWALDAGDRIPPRDTSTPVWYATVCRTLGSIASEKGTQLWIAIDLGAVSEAPEIAEFCERFVQYMPNPAFGNWFRLMLIRYPDGSVPARWVQDVWHEYSSSGMEVDQPDVGTEVDLQDLADYLGQHAAAPDGTVWTIRLTRAG